MNGMRPYYGPHNKYRCKKRSNKISMYNFLIIESKEETKSQWLCPTNKRLDLALFRDYCSNVHCHASAEDVSKI